MSCQGDWKRSTGRHINPAKFLCVVIYFQSVNALTTLKARDVGLFSSKT